MSYFAPLTLSFFLRFQHSLHPLSGLLNFAISAGTGVCVCVRERERGVEVCCILELNTHDYA